MSCHKLYDSILLVFINVSYHSFIIIKTFCQAMQSANRLGEKLRKIRQLKQVPILFYGIWQEAGETFGYEYIMQMKNGGRGKRCTTDPLFLGLTPPNARKSSSSSGWRLLSAILSVSHSQQASSLPRARDPLPNRNTVKMIISAKCKFSTKLAKLKKSCFLLVFLPTGNLTFTLENSFFLEIGYNVVQSCL